VISELRDLHPDQCDDEAYDLADAHVAKSLIDAGVILSEERSVVVPIDKFLAVARDAVLLEVGKSLPAWAWRQRNVAEWTPGSHSNVSLVEACVIADCLNCLPLVDKQLSDVAHQVMMYTT
jgi:hypothetical protein